MFKIASIISPSIMVLTMALLFDINSCSKTLMLITAVLVAARILMGIYSFFTTMRSNRKIPLPPGPKGYPILGFLPLMKQDSHLQFTELGERYGSVYQIFLGCKRVIVVSDPTLIREAFKKTVFSGRPDTELTKLLGGYGIINADGDRWREQRSFLHSVLRDFGAKNSGHNQSALEKNITSQVSEFLDSVQQTSGEAFYIRVHLARSISNVIGSILMSVTFEQNDKSFPRLLHVIEDGFRLLTLAVPVNFIPILRFFPLLNSAYRQIKKNIAETTGYFAKVAKYHQQTLDVNNVRDFVDAFYVQQQKVQANKKDTFFTEKQLLQVLGDIFSAGLETVTSLLEWGIIYMVRYPDVQKKVQEEIDCVVGTERLPELKDLPNMPYTEATMLEMMRTANVIALGNSHATLDDTELGGFFIPKNSHILPNLWAIHMNPELWDNPREFRPERFLVNGKVVKPSYFMPFSVGRRMCVGDTLAKMEVFLFLTHLLQRFNVCAPEGASPPPLNGEANVSLKPMPYKLCTVPRDL